MSDITLSDEAIAELCAGISQPAARVRLLRSEGFVRARLRAGKVILEVDHYKAVCEGRYGTQARQEHNIPRVNVKAVKA